jgi:hypothetical protein
MAQEKSYRLASCVKYFIDGILPGLLHSYVELTRESERANIQGRTEQPGDCCSIPA